MINQVLAFIKSTSQPRNIWLKDDFMQIYVRRSLRLLNGREKLVPMIDLATIQVDQPGRGTFTGFLQALEQQVEIPIFVENVLNERFAEFFRNRAGWLRASKDLILPCFVGFHPDSRPINQVDPNEQYPLYRMKTPGLNPGVFIKET